MIRVLVVDDSATARALLIQILSGDPEIQIVGEARDGAEGVEMTLRLRPDLVTMDMRMPRMDGLAATKEIMIVAPTPIVIVTASLKEREVEAAMQSLNAGAVALLRKPPGPESPDFREAAAKLVAMVKAMAQVRVVRHWRSVNRLAPHPPVAARLVPMTNPVVAIAASTGGPAALNQVLSRLPGDFPAPILVVQHNAPGFMAGLVSWLNASCAVHVKLAEPGEPLKPRTVYFAPDDHHLAVSVRATTVFTNGPPVSGFRPSATVLFDSVARVFGSSVVALILTGMGADGVDGLRQVRQAGGRIIAQDEHSSVVWGMPGAAVGAALPHIVAPLDEISSRLLELVVGP